MRSISSDDLEESPTKKQRTCKGPAIMEVQRQVASRVDKDVVDSNLYYYRSLVIVVSYYYRFRIILAFYYYCFLFAAVSWRNHYPVLLMSFRARGLSIAALYGENLPGLHTRSID